MQTVSQHISNLLFDHNCVIVPGLGGFVANYQSARMHPTSYIFNSPSKSVAFNINLKHNDGLLLYHLVSEEHLTVDEAENRILHFVREVTDSLSDSKVYKINRVGRLIKDIEGVIKFEPDTTNNYLQDAYGLYTINAQPILRELQIDKSIVKDEIVFQPEIKKKQSYKYLIPAAAIIIITLMIGQIFLLTNKSGYDLSDLSGIGEFFNKKEYNAKLYGENNLKINEIYVHQYRVAEVVSDSLIADVQMLSDEVSKDISADKRIVNEVSSSYLIIAGAFGKEEYTTSVINKLAKKNYSAAVIYKNKLYMVAVNIPEGENRSRYRSVFAETTGIKGAWVLKNKE